MGKQSRRNRTPPTMQYNHRVLGIFNPGEDVGFMYTVGLHPNTCELFALNVPRADSVDLCRLMNFLSTRDVTDGQSALSKEHLLYFTRTVDDADRDHALKTEYLCQMDPRAKTVELLRVP